MFMPASPRFTFNPQRPQYQAGASTPPPQPISNPLQNPQTGTIAGMNPLQAQLVAQQGKAMVGRADMMNSNNAQIQNAGGAGLDTGQQIGGILGFNDYGMKGGAADAIRNQQGMAGDVQGPPMPMDMFKGMAGKMQTPDMTQSSGFFPSWLSSMFS